MDELPVGDAETPKRGQFDPWSLHIASITVDVWLQAAIRSMS